MAASAVLNTYELVLLIVPFLDDLSLVRVQAVNQIFRNVVSTMYSTRRLLINHRI